MKNFITISCLLLFLSACSVDRLAILIRQYNSGTLTAEKNDKLENKFASAKEQFSYNATKTLLILYIEGLTYEKRNNYATALKIFTKITEKNNAILDVWLHIANLYTIMGKEKESRTAYLRCLKIINDELRYMEEGKWPKEHILSDDHVKYAVHYSMIDNSYLTSDEKGNWNYGKMRKNLLILKDDIELKLKK